jgi:hypothetical protein
MAGLRSAWWDGAAKGFRVAAFVCAVLVVSAGAAADGEGAKAGTDADGIASLASAGERLVERSKPAEWALRRSCLYYAFAGQHLLARQGISAAVWVGAVVYDPGTAASHQIWPHAWLETATHFIDFSALPRWGTVKVIPRHLVARSPWEVRPGTTRVLALPRLEDLQVVAYLAFHRERFDRRAKDEN